MKPDMESVVSDAEKALDTLEDSPMNTKDNMLVSDSTSNAASDVSSDTITSAAEDVSDNHKNPNPNNAPGYKPKSSATQNAETKDPDQKTAGAKFTRTAARGAAAYFTGGQSLQYDQEVGKVAQPLVDGVGNVIDKTPGVSQAAEALDDVGALDVAEHGLNTAGDALKGDIGGAVKEGFKTVKGVNKMFLRIVISAASSLFLFFAMVLVVALPIVDGIIRLTDGSSDGSGSQQAVVDGATQSGSLSTESINDMVNETPSISEMASDRQKIIATAASAVGMNYNWGGHPNGPGLAGIPTKGLDCAGYVQWVLWTALGENPGYLTTSSISQQIGSNFIRITQDQLQPGDIGLKRLGGSSESSTNHTGIYAGNGQWYHAQGKNSGIVHNSYNSFTIYLRYKGVS